MAVEEINVSDQIVAFKRKMAPRRDALKRAYASVTDHVRRATEKIHTECGCRARRDTRSRVRRDQGRQGSGGGAPGDPQDRLRRRPRRVPGRARERVVRGGRRVSRDEPVRGARGREAEPRQVFLRAQGRQAANLQRLLVEAAGAWRGRTRSSPRRAPFSIGSGNTRASSIPTGNAPMPTACAAGSRATRRSACRRTWMRARSSAGSIPATSRSTRRSSPATGAATIPFDGTHRLETREIPSPAVCSMFRTYQGWTALTQQGPNDGTLRLIPIAEGISYVLLRALQDDVAGGRSVRRRCRAARSASARNGTPTSWPASSRFPRSCPATRCGGTPTSVTRSATSMPARSMRASSTSARRPTAPKNRAYLPKQKRAFLDGRSAPDFAAMDFEVDFQGRATEKDLTDSGGPKWVSRSRSRTRAVWLVGQNLFQPRDGRPCSAAGRHLSRVPMP